MDIGWQNAVSFGLALAAAVYLIRRLWCTWRGKQRIGCGACGALQESPRQRPLISITPPENDRHGDDTTA